MITGCTVNYELEIKEDLSLIEQITILNNESYFDKEGEVQSRYKYLVDLGMKENNYFSYNYLEKNNLYG